MVRTLGFISTREAGTALDNYTAADYKAAGLPLPGAAAGAGSFSQFLDQNKTAVIAGSAALLLLAVVASMNRS